MATNIIDPQTGLPPRTQKKPDELPLPPRSKFGQSAPGLSPFEATPIRSQRGTFGEYADYGVSFSPYANMEEERARNQPWYEQLGNGVAKAGATFLGAFGEGTIGYGLGLGDYILSGFEDFEESMTNNPVGRRVDEMNERMQENFPNYYTDEERAQVGTLNELGSMNFYSDKLLNGLAYSAGSIASTLALGLTTGGAGFGVAAARLGLQALGRGARLSKGMAALQAGRLASQSKKAKDIMDGINKFSQGASLVGNRALNAAGYLEAGAMMSIAEASVEAREVHDRTIQALNHQTMLRNGYKTEDEIPLSEKEKIKATAERMRGTAFYGNLAVLMPSNLFMFGRGLAPFKVGEGATRALTKEATEATGKGWSNYLTKIDALPGAARKGFKYSEAIYPWLKGGVTEYGQESAQYVISEGLVERAKAMYKTDGAEVDFAKSMLGASLFSQEGREKIARNARDLAAVAGKAPDYMSQPEGKSQGMVGGLVGLLTGGLASGGKSSMKRKNDNTQTALEDLNLEPEVFGNLYARAAESRIGQYHLTKMIQAAENKDEKAYYDHQSRLLSDKAIMHTKLGTFDQFVERLEEIKAMPVDQASEILGVKLANEEEKTQTMERLINHSKFVNKRYNQISEMFPTKGTPMGSRLLGTQRNRNRNAQNAETEILRNAYTFYESSLYDIDGRVEDIIQKFAKADPQFNEEAFRSAVRKNMFREVSVAENEEGEEVLSYEIGTGVDEEAELRKEILKSIQRIRYAPKFTRPDTWDNPGWTKEMERQGEQLLALLDDRATAMRAYEELQLSPENRELFVKRMKAIEEIERTKAIDKNVDDAIAETETARDLQAREEALNQLDLSEQAEKRLEDEIRGRQVQESELDLEYQRMNRSAVESINPDDLQPWERDVRNQHLKNRDEKKEEPLIKVTEAQRKEEKKKAATKSVNSRDAKKRVEDEKERKKKKKKKKKKKGKTLADYAEQSASAKVVAAGNKNGMTRAGNQFEVDEDGKVYVDNQGKPIRVDVNHKVDGQDIITNRERLHDPIVGEEVTFRVIESDWWNNEADPEEKMDAAIHIPIYIELDGDIIGVLDAADTPLRDTIYQAFKENKNGTVTGTISEQLVSGKNIYTAVTRDGRAFQYNLNTFTNRTTKPILAVVAVNPEDNVTKELNLGALDESDLGYTADELLQLQADVADINARMRGVDNDFNFTPGQVVMLAKDPRGKFRPIVIHTSNLTQPAIETAIRMMREGQGDLLRALMGVNTQYYIDAENEVTTSDIGFFVEPMGDQFLYTFRPKNADGTNILPQGLMFQISSELLDRALSNPKDGRALFSEGKKGVSEKLNLVVEPFVDPETGKIGYKSLGKSYAKEAMGVMTTLNQVLPNTLKLKKFNIDKDFLNLDREGAPVFEIEGWTTRSYPTYLDYLTDEQFGTTSGGQGAGSILKTQAQPVDNRTPFVNIGLMFDAEFEQAEEVKPAETVNKKDKGKVGKATSVASRDRLGDTSNPNNDTLTPVKNPFRKKGKKRREEAPSLEELKKRFDLEDEEARLKEQEYLERAQKRAKANRKKRIQGYYDSLLADENRGLTPSEAEDETRERFNIPPDEPMIPRRTNVKHYKKMDAKQAKAWLKSRGIPVEVYDMAVKIGGGTVHGYFQNAAVKLWADAEVGTEYHEAFHYAFRVFLNDKQRAAVYKEMREKMMSDDAMQEMVILREDQLRQQFPEASRKEIEDLALEEILAEEFRDYVILQQSMAETLPGRIRKFFRDLYMLIRSMFVDPAGVEQLFYLLESNVIPRSFVRNTESLSEPANTKVYRYVEQYMGHEQTHEDLKQISVLQFESEYMRQHELQLQKDASSNYGDVSGETVRATIGDEARPELGKGSVANWFLQASVSYEATGGKLNEEDFREFREKVDQYEETKDEADLMNFMEEKGIEFFPHNDVHEGTQELDEERQEIISDMYLDVYMNWFDKITEDEFENPIQTGWRSVMFEGLQQHGYNITKMEEAAGYVAEDVFEDEVQSDKIYAKASFETSPLEESRLSAAARLYFANIKNIAPNSLGVVTYSNMDTLVRKAIAAAKNARETSKILNALETATELNPELIPLVDHLNELTETNDVQQFATITNFLKLDYTRHIVFDRAFDADGNKTVNVFDSDRSMGSRVMFNRWKKTREKNGIPSENALYIEDVDGKLSIKDPEGKADRLNEARRIYIDPTTTGRQKAHAMADMLWELGITVGQTKQESREILNAYADLEALDQSIMADRDVDPRDVMTQLGRSLMITQLTKTAFEMDGDFVVGEAKNVRDMFIARTQGGKSLVKGLRNLAEELGPMIEQAEALGFLGADGKMRYAYQLPTHFNYMMKQMRDGTAMKNLLAKDPRFHMYGREDYQDILYYLMQRSDFVPEVGEFDVMKDEDEAVGNTTFKNLFDRDSLMLRMDAFLNGKNPTKTFVPISTQEARPRLSMMGNLPRLLKGGAMKQFGVSHQSREKHFRNIIMQDLIGIAEAERVIDEGDPNKIIPGYHTVYTENGKVKQNKTYLETHLLGRADKKLVKLAKDLDKVLSNKLDQSKFGIETLNEIDKLAAKFMKQGYATAVEQTTEMFKEYGLIREEEVEDEDGNVTVEVEHSFDELGVKNAGGLDNAIRDYVATDIIYRISMARVFRGGVNMHKNEIDFFKRMGLINTPGYGLFMKGDFEGNPNYGMAKYFNSMTLHDFTIQEKQHDDIADGYANRVGEDIGKNYRREAVPNISDAQAFISPEMAVMLEQGNARWTAKDDIWYNNYKKGEGKWMMSYTPNYKPFYESQKLMGNTMTVEMDKNSYVVLTRELAQGSDVLMELYNRMTDPVTPIHVVNMVSAKKGSKEKAVTYAEMLNKDNSELVVQQEGAKLLMPQMINERGKDLVRLNKQITKDTLALVDPAGTYTLNYGTELAQPMTGQQLKDTFHTSFIELQRRAMAKLMDDLGLSEADERGLIPNEKRLDALKKMRKMLMAEKVDRGELNQNALKQMNIGVDPYSGLVDFQIPLGFPTYMKNYENLFFTLFKNRVMKMFMKGKEMVQVAAPGKFDVFNYDTGQYENRELKYLEFTEDGYLGHAEVMISADIAKKYGIKKGDDLSKIPVELRRAISYRIPHQGKNSTILVKIAGVLPESYSKTIMLPGNITVMTGSDFDIDKLFVMFPEFIGNRKEGFKKVMPDPELGLEEQSAAALRNQMLDVIEAVSASILHADETLTPLTTDNLERIAEQELKVDLDSNQYPFWHPLSEIEMEQKFKAAAAGVGVYANAMSGFNIMSQGNAVYAGKPATRVDISRAFTMNGVQRDHITSSKAASAYFREKLSSHLDSGKKPIPGATNDNKFTFPATVFFGSFILDGDTSMDDVTAIELLMNLPKVKEYVKMRKTNSGFSKAKALNEMGISYADQRMIEQGSMKRMHRMSNMSVESLRDLYDPAKRKELSSKVLEQRENAMFKNFAIALIAGDQLSDAYKIVAPDTLDGLTELGGIQAYKDIINKYAMNKRPIVSAESVEQFLTSPRAFGVSYSHFLNINQFAQLSNNFFGGAAPAVEQFKNRVKAATGQKFFTAPQHRTLNRAVFYHLLTAPRIVNGEDINPLSELLDAETVKDLFTGVQPGGTIHSELAAMRRAAPKLQQENYFFSRLIPSEVNQNSRTFVLQINDLDDMSTDTQDRMIQGFENMLYNADMYAEGDPEVKADIENFAQMLVLNALVATGAAPAYGAFFEFIPARYLQTTRKSDELDEDGNYKYPTIAEFVRMQMMELQNNDDMVNNFLFEFLRQFGTSKLDNMDLVPIKSLGKKRGQLKKKGEIYTLRGVKAESLPPFIKVRNKRPKKQKGKVVISDNYQLLQLKKIDGRVSGYVYEPVQQKGIVGKLYETNLRDEEGRTEGVGSVISAANKADRLRNGVLYINPAASKQLNAPLDKLMTSNAELNEKILSMKCE